jgi:hypothetical protein
MKRFYGVGVLALLLAAAAFIDIPAHSQDKQPAGDTKREISLKVQVVFEEYDGQKKIASLPYAFRVVTNGNNSSIRDGLRVPVSTGGSTAEKSSQYQYMDVGANIDCNAWPSEDGAYKVKLNVQRTFLFSPDELKPAADLNRATLGPGGNPVVGTFYF